MMCLKSDSPDKPVFTTLAVPDFDNLQGHPEAAYISPSAYMLYLANWVLNLLHIQLVSIIELLFLDQEDHF